MRTARVRIQRGPVVAALASIAYATITLWAGSAFALSATEVDVLTPAELGVVEEGGSLSFQLSLSAFDDPDITITSIDSAWLLIGILDDDDWMAEPEAAAIRVNDEAWGVTQATAALVWGDVTALLSEGNGLIDVLVSSAEADGGSGDFRVAWSLLYASFTFEWNIGSGVGTAGVTPAPSGAVPAPEPSAALVFVIGALIVRRGIRERRRT